MKQAGFTLLELLVAMLVLGMVSLLLFQGVQFGIQAQAQQAGLRTRTGDVGAVDHALRQLIAKADPGHFPEPSALRGQPHGLRFTTDLPLHGAGQVRRADVALSVEAGRLVLRWQPNRHVALFAPAPPPEQTVLLDGVEQIELAYRTASGTWRESWAGETLPALIRLRLVFTPGSGRTWPPIVAAPLREAVEP